MITVLLGPRPDVTLAKAKAVANNKKISVKDMAKGELKNLGCIGMSKKDLIIANADAGGYFGRLSQHLQYLSREGYNFIVTACRFTNDGGVIPEVTRLITVADKVEKLKVYCDQCGEEDAEVPDPLGGVLCWSCFCERKKHAGNN